MQYTDQDDHIWVKRYGLLGLIVWVAFMVINHSALAHDTWANGTVVPSWVKASCCGPRDAHNLTLEGIGWREVPGGFKIDGIDDIIPTSKALPSQDGDAWAFYYQRYPGTSVYCLFVPMGF